MLNELYRLSLSLKKAGVQPPRKHPRVKLPGTSAGAAVRVRLGEVGNIAGTEAITAAEWPGLWHVLDGKHNAFPVSNLSKNKHGDGWDRDKSAQLLRRLAGKAEELRRACLASQEAAAVVQVCERFQRAMSSPTEFCAELIEILDRNRARRIAFDAEEGTIFSSDTRSVVERLLPMAKTGTGKKVNHPARACAYSRSRGELQTGPFPTVRLPVLNKDSPLVSMFHDAPCNTRYGLTDSSVVPVSKTLALEMQDALDYIVHEHRRDQTWRGVWNGHFAKSQEQRDLLVAYVEGAVATPSKVASIFGVGGSDTAQFQADASAVCDALDGIARQQPESRLGLFLLRGVSEGQVQVQVSSRPTVREVIHGARLWQEGGKNIPVVLIPAQNKAGRLNLVPRTPYPDELVSITSRQWLEAGKRWSPARGAAYGQILTVMLRGSGWQPSAEYLLDRINRRTWPLLMGLFGAVLRLEPESAHRHGYSERSCLRAAKSVSALGILLGALGIRKEEYVSEPTFLVGRLLALVDLLQRRYSTSERRSKPPSQLIGNALMSLARDNPQGAVARLNDRLPFYTAWAERSDDRLAGWAVARIRDTATTLAASVVPSSTNEREKAQLMLGYISKLSESTEEGHGYGDTTGGHDE